MTTQQDLTALPARSDIAPTVSRRQVTRALRFAQPVLAQRLDRPGVAAVLPRMLTEYRRVAPAVPRLKAPMSRMTLRIAVDALVLYRSLPQDLPPPERLAIMSDFVTAWMLGQFDRPLTRWVYRHSFTHLLLRRAWFASANRLDEPDGWRFRYHPGRPDLFYGVDVTRCGIVRFLAAQGALELAPLMCRGDYQVTRYLPPGVTFERSQVIAEGAPFCDFRYRSSR